MFFFFDCQQLEKTWYTADGKHLCFPSLSGHLTPSFPCWSAFTPPGSSCGQPGPCSMSAARMVRNWYMLIPKLHVTLLIHLFIHKILTGSHFGSYLFTGPQHFNHPPPPSPLVAARYCSMLLEEGGLQQLELVHTHPQTHADVKVLAKSILESLQHHQARTGQLASTHTSRRVPPQ